MLQLHDITIAYGTQRVITHFSCHVPAGGFVCLTGRSGCGKSSLLKAIIGLVPVTEGTIHVQGQLLTAATCDALRTQTAYLPQDLSFPTEHVVDMVLQTLRLRNNRHIPFNKGHMHSLMQQLGLEQSLLDKRLSEISGGQRQRIMLATIALLNKPLWLLDEPTAALDSASRDLVIRFLVQQRQQGTTIVCVSHDTCFADHCSTIIPL